MLWSLHWPSMLEVLFSIPGRFQNRVLASTWPAEVKLMESSSFWPLKWPIQNWNHCSGWYWTWFLSLYIDFVRLPAFSYSCFLLFTYFCPMPWIFRIGVPVSSHFLTPPYVLFLILFVYQLFYSFFFVTSLFLSQALSSRTGVPVSSHFRKPPNNLPKLFKDPN